MCSRGCHRGRAVAAVRLRDCSSGALYASAHHGHLSIVACNTSPVFCRQTLYRSVFEKGPQRTFNASLLHPDVCPEKHFTVRLWDHGNRTDGKPIVWGAVIGLGEQFTFLEIVEFPTYVSTPRFPVR